MLPIGCLYANKRKPTSIILVWSSWPARALKNPIKVFRSLHSLFSRESLFANLFCPGLCFFSFSLQMIGLQVVSAPVYVDAADYWPGRWLDCKHVMADAPVRCSTTSVPRGPQTCWSCVPPSTTTSTTAMQVQSNSVPSPLTHWSSP